MIHFSEQSTDSFASESLRLQRIRTGDGDDVMAILPYLESAYITLTLVSALANVLGCELVRAGRSKQSLGSEERSSGRYRTVRHDRCGRDMIFKDPWR